MSANGKKWSQYSAETALADSDEVLVRDVSEVAANQVKRMTKANLSTDLGLSGHLADATLHMTRDEINDRALSKEPLNGLSFDGVDDLVTLTPHAITTNDFSWSGIIRVDTEPTINDMVAQTRGSGGVGISVYFTSSYRLIAKLNDGAGNVDTLTSASAYAISGKAYHWAVTVDRNGDFNLYVNGDVAATTSTTAVDTGLDTGNNIVLGSRNGAEFFEGIMHSFVAWDKALSASEVATLVANGNQVPVADQWSVAVASYQSRNIESGTWLDESSNEDNGTISGATRLFEPKAQVSGTFTPTLTFSTATGTITYTDQEGEWLKLADGAYLISINLAVDTISGHSGNIQIEGLPFAAKSGTLSQPITCNVFDQVTPGAGVEAQIVAGASYIQLFEANAATTRVSSADVQAGTRFRLQGVLRTA